MKLVSDFNDDSNQSYDNGMSPENISRPFIPKMKKMTEVITKRQKVKQGPNLCLSFLL